jgi:hypothetical protein
VRDKIAAIMLAITVASAGGSACAMNNPNYGPRCEVVGAELLPAEAGGADAICAAIRAAAESQAPGVSFSVEVRVQSASSLAATVRLADGRTLAEQKMAVSDRQLNRGSIDRFAAAIAAEIGRTSNR